MLNINEILNTKKSKINFIKGLINIAKANDVLEESEKAFFMNAAVSLNLNNSEIELITTTLNNSENIIEVEFDNKKQALFFFREALQLCFIDGTYDTAEREIINRIRERTSVDQKDLDTIEKWVLEGISWSKKGENLITGEV